MSGARRDFDPRSRAGLEEILATVRVVAREAGDLVSSAYRKRPVAEHKGTTDLVTEFDRASEALIRTRLEAAYDCAVIGEEAGGQPARIAFYVDPIDGTTNFVHGHPFWCVSIGLVVDEEPILGVVSAPALGVEWAGFALPSGERHALRTSALGAEECRPSAAPRGGLAGAFLATGFPYDRQPSREDNFDTFVAIKRQCLAVRRCGSAAMDLCLVADGTYDGYWERKVRPWDIAGGGAIVRAAGGTLSDFQGGTRFLASGQVVATNGHCHAELLAAVMRPSG